MYNNVYFYLILKLFLYKNNIIINIFYYNFKLNNFLKKKIFYLFYILKNNFEKKINYYSTKKDWVSSSGFSMKTLSFKSKKLINNLGDDFSFINLKNKKLSKGVVNSLLFSYYSIYSSFFNFIFLKSNKFLNKFFIFYVKKRREKISFLNFFLFRKNFFKTIYLITNILFLNYLPIIITDRVFSNDLDNFNYFLKKTNNKLKYGLIFCTSPFVQLKNISKFKKKKIPLIAIADLNTNTKWIDYPIIINKSNKHNSFFFLNFILSIFFSMIFFKKKNYIKLYKNYIKLNYLKEFILKNEYVENVIRSIFYFWD